MKRCGACGGFYDAAECPNLHDIEVTYPPLPSSPSSVGRIVTYNWPGSGPVACLVTSDEDADGFVGLMVLHENVRVHLDDVEES